MDKKRKIEYDIAYIKMAECMSELSDAIRSQVGCVIVSEDGQIISQGFNGMPTGFSNICEYAVMQDGTPAMLWDDCGGELPDDEKKVILERAWLDGTVKLETKPEVLHAETNAISKCAKLMASTENSTIYVTLSPCFGCSKSIIQSGIKRVVYKDLYRDTAGLDLLTKAGVKCELIDIANKKLVRYNLQDTSCCSTPGKTCC